MCVRVKFDKFSLKSCFRNSFVTVAARVVGSCIRVGRIGRLRRDGVEHNFIPHLKSTSHRPKSGVGEEFLYFLLSKGASGATLGFWRITFLWI